MDLDLKEINQFYGTEKYHKIRYFNTLLTDGVIYVMKNGYSWVVTDALAWIELKLKGKSDFFVIKLKIEDDKAKIIIDDGNNKIYHKKSYGYTTAKRELKFYWDNGVLMLSNEY